MSVFHKYLLGGDTTALSGLYARLCHAFSSLFYVLHTTNRKAVSFHHFLVVSFKNCKTFLEVMVFQQPTLFVCIIHMMNHIIGTVLLYPYIFSLIYYFVYSHIRLTDAEYQPLVSLVCGPGTANCWKFTYADNICLWSQALTLAELKYVCSRADTA